ncbi:MAG: hypothetical protein DI546_01655 [Rhizobium sp.]|nr:MAG: hypothetical protein DI546_01655 [Rhizobium sp.]
MQDTSSAICQGWPTWEQATFFEFWSEEVLVNCRKDYYGSRTCAGDRPSTRRQPLRLTNGGFSRTDACENVAHVSANHRRAGIDDREVAAIRKRLRESKLTPSQILGQKNKRLVTAAARALSVDMASVFQEKVRVLYAKLKDMALNPREKEAARCSRNGVDIAGLPDCAPTAEQASKPGFMPPLTARMRARLQDFPDHWEFQAVNRRRRTRSEMRFRQDWRRPSGWPCSRPSKE